MQYFFNPRGVQLTLAQGGLAFSGQSDGPPPDVAAGRYQPASPNGGNYDNYDPAGIPGGRAARGTQQGRAGQGQKPSRRERRQLRRGGGDDGSQGQAASGRGAGRGQRRQRGRDERAVRDEHWRLVISPVRMMRSNDVLWSR